MGWSQPFLDLMLSRTATLQAGFAAASREITKIVDVLDGLSEQESASPADRNSMLRKLKRAIRDVQWRAFEDLELSQQSQQRVRLRELHLRFRECLTRIAQAATTSSGLPPVSTDEGAVEELLTLRRQFADEERRLLARWSGVTAAIRYAVLFGTAAGTAFLVLYSGLTIQRFKPLAPTPEYEMSRGTYRLRDSARDAIVTRYSEFLLNNLYEISSLPAQFVGDADESSKKGEKTKRPVGVLFQHVCAFELLNRSYVQSEYVGTVTSRIRLVKREPFPWRDVFPADDRPKVRFEPADKSPRKRSEWMGRLVNEASSPVLVEVTIKADELAIVTLRDYVLRNSAPHNLYLDSDWSLADRKASPSVPPSSVNPRIPRIPSLPEGLVPFSPPSPPEGFDQYAPPPEGEPSPPDLLQLFSTDTISSPTTPGAESSTSEIIGRLEAGTIVDVEWKYETVDGKSIQERSTMELPMPLIRLRNPRAQTPNPSGGAGLDIVAALLGKATTVGEHTIRVDLPLDVVGMREGEVRTTTVPVDRYLQRRGYLTLYSQFSPTACGVYELVVDIDGRAFDGQKIAVICPEIGTAGTLTAAQFRTIQQRFKELEDSDDSEAGTMANAP